jgi:hypothetical protein
VIVGVQDRLNDWDCPIQNDDENNWEDLIFESGKAYKHPHSIHTPTSGTQRSLLAVLLHQDGKKQQSIALSPSEVRVNMLKKEKNNLTIESMLLERKANTSPYLKSCPSGMKP